MKLVFASNYFNHHQKPLSDALAGTEGIDYTFLEIEEMDPERVSMGWGIDTSDIPYVKKYSEDAEKAKAMIMDADAVIFGGVDDESYIMPRLEAGRLTFRYHERIYKEGQWKFISPAGLKKKYHDHIRFKNDPDYLLCAGGYVASDFSLIGAYPDKKYVWGYFPECIEYDIDELMEKKRMSDRTEILWSGRMIDWKHPEDAIEAVACLKNEGVDFHLTMIGGGEMESRLKQMAEDRGISDDVTFTGFLKPDEVRARMELADIYLFTSDQKEGWGAVLNESMNSGCCVIASSAIGAVPFMLEHCVNGLVYKSRRVKELSFFVKKAVESRKLREKLGRNAYASVHDIWNADNAAACFVKELKRLTTGIPADRTAEEKEGICPMDKAPVISPLSGYGFVRRNMKDKGLKA